MSKQVIGFGRISLISLSSLLYLIIKTLYSFACFSLSFRLSFQILQDLFWTMVHATEQESPPLMLPYHTNHLCCLGQDGESACLHCPTLSLNTGTPRKHIQLCLNTSHTSLLYFILGTVIVLLSVISTHPIQSLWRIIHCHSNNSLMMYSFLLRRLWSQKAVC